ncbi:hypothetical protein KZ813_00175 [Sphingomonas sp. RHCKR7]|uniref:hypothetical protein n=1 Tax=Sphingomonas folli TaxID=2862497 RepID=UPI001CA4BE78|nr:hypothetical protein [Sphingomonas folli]MBW6525251.1 hypothetical protein [Sphingomonas folli]
MKYPERMSRRGSRPFHTTIATTFSIEFAALEELMLPHVLASGATNLLVVADERMASMSLSDGSPLPRQLGRDYELISPPVSDGLFHPKILLQVGRRSGRLFVGSANVTAAGLAGNAETVMEIECGDEPSPEREIVRSAWRYLDTLVPRDSRTARDALIWAAERAPWLAGAEPSPLQLLDDGTGVAFLVRRADAGIGTRFVDLVGGDAVERLVVASPYWDEDLRALSGLVASLSPASTAVLLDPAGTEFPVDVPLPSGVSLRAYPSSLGGRFKHAKFLIASTATHDHLLIGSANCTVAALGGRGHGGSNAEACIYRSLARDRAVDALGLAECLSADGLDPSKVKKIEWSPPIPFAELGSRRAGTFELDGCTLGWSPPPCLSGRGRLRLLDIFGFDVGEIQFDLPLEDSRTTFLVEGADSQDLAFVVVEQDGFVSNPAHISHRPLLRRRRREVASGAVAKAIGAFDAGADLDLWLHQAFDELARADIAARPAPTPAAARPHGAAPASEDKVERHLSYEEFMEVRSPDSRAVGRKDCALAGTHSDIVRGFLNLLIGGASNHSPAQAGTFDDSWMELGDEDQERDLDEETRRAEADAVEPAIEPPPATRRIDGGQYEKMVRAYVAKLTVDEGACGPSDVLRLRFWLTMLLHKARHDGLPQGLAADVGEQGWPRMALRVVAAFFCGRRAPIKRLMISREFIEMPVDFLECWATVLWVLEAIERAVPSSSHSREFLAFVVRLRRAVVKVLGLTPAELSGETMSSLRSALERSFGARLQLRSGRAA